MTAPSPAAAQAAALTIPEFCERNRLSRSTLHALWRIGRGPRRLQIGRTVRVTVDAERDWQRDVERFPIPIFRDAMDSASQQRVANRAAA